MILSPNNTPILDIEEFTKQYPNHDYAAYFDSKGKTLKHNLFISLEEWKLQESIREKMSTPYEWKLRNPDEPVVVIRSKEKGSPVIVLPSKKR